MRKIEEDAPCLITVPTIRKGKVDERKIAPSVECDGKCENCAWNPTEHQRRMAGGFTLAPDGTMSLEVHHAEQN